jgi:hypothetical protein
MEDTVLIHGDHWKVSDIKDEVEWCRNQKWRKQSFIPRDAVKQKHSVTERQSSGAVPTGGEIIKDGWEHEHCQVCWWKIRESNNPEIGIGYTNGNQWLCSECYGQFIEVNVLGISS